MYRAIATQMADNKKEHGNLALLKTTTKADLVSAINENFTNVSNGKTSIATAITDKGVNASSGDTFSVLANKIGLINTGRSWASGYTLELSNLETNSENYIEVTGLDFKPSTIIVAGPGNYAGLEIYGSFVLPINIHLTFSKLKSGAGNGIKRAPVRSAVYRSLYQGGFKITTSTGVEGATSTYETVRSPAYLYWFAIE